MRNSVFAALVSILLVAPVLFAAPELPVSSVARQRAAFHQRAPRIATDGTNFLVGWYDDRMPDVPLYVTRIGPDGKPLDASPIRLPQAQLQTAGFHVLTWTGNVYIVGWTDWDRRTFRWVRVDRDGRVLDAQPREIAGITTPHAAASVNGRTLIIHTGEWPETPLYGQFIEADGTAAGERITFPRAGRSDWSPVIATNDDGFYVAWTRFFGTSVDLVGVPVTLDGTFGTVRTLASGSTVNLASDGESYLLAYTTTNDTLVTEQLDGAGTTLVRTVHEGTRLYSVSDLAASGSGYLLAAFTATGAEARVLDAAGVETGRLPLDASSTSTTSIVLGAHANAAVAVWSEDFDRLPSGSDMFAEAIDTRRDRVLLSQAAPRQTELRIATDGNGFLGAWLESRDRSELRVGRISANGAPLDGEGIVLAEHVNQPPAVTFDGANYVVAWIEEKPSGDCAVRAARVTHEGLNLDGNGKVVSQTCAAAIGLGSNGREALLVRSTSEYDPNTNRLRNALLANRLQRDLTIDAPVELPSSSLRGFDIAVGAMEDLWLVAWTRYSDTADCGLCNPPLPPTYDVDAVRLSDDLALLDAEALQLGATENDRAPSIASNGTEFLVVWERLSDKTIQARRVLRFGISGDEPTVTTGRAPSVVARDGAFVIGFEENGDLFTTTFRTPGRTPIATSADREHSVRLVNTAAGLTAAYLRVASESLYNFVDRGFLRMLDTTPRRRAIRK